MTYLYEALDKPSRLYIKQCSHCDLKYFGKTVSEDIETYGGSGMLWRRHLKKHKARSIHIWNSEWFYDKSIINYALNLSKELCIVENKEWANLKNETGIDGGDTSQFIDYSKCNTPEQIAKRKETMSTPEWKSTIGKRKSDSIKRKYRERMSNREWVENVLQPSRETQSNTMSTLRKENPYEIKICEKCGVKTDPGNYKKCHGEKCGIKINVTCPHCLKTGSGGVMNRWHFANCKYNKEDWIIS